MTDGPADASGSPSDASADSASARATKARVTEHLGGALTEAGLAPLPSRVFSALLVDDDGRMTSAELTTALGVSAGGVSGAVRYLAQLGLIRRERERGSRRDVYVVDDDAWRNAMLREEQMFPALMAALATGLDELGPDSPARGRLTLSLEFLEFVRHEMRGIAERWAARHPQ